MTNVDFSEQWKSMQKMFLPTTVLSESFRESARRFWENQDKFLENMHAFANNWFDHRHAGTRSAQEAAERMCRTDSIVDMVQAYQDWAKGAFERMMADGLACQQQIIAATGAFTSPPIVPPATEKNSETTRPETKVPVRTKST